MYELTDEGNINMCRNDSFLHMKYKHERKPMVFAHNQKEKFKIAHV